MSVNAPKNGEGQSPKTAAMLPKLPPDIKIMEFARHRAQEVVSLTAVIEHPGGSNKRIFQQLPRHMRRRAMSHSIKRVPRRLQEIQKRELEKFGKKASKRPSRKHRRRPSQLLQAYNRRQRDFIWLETHIWHAKRFKMTSDWGYKIPLHPNDKSVRACYRASARAVLLQDLSYHCCIELKGPRQAMLDVLSRMTNPDCGLTFSSKMYASGCREGSTIVYRCDRYPFEAIGPVKFLWRPASVSNEEVLWIWAHPSGFKTLLDELVAAFGVRQAEGEQNPADKEKLELLQQKQHEKLAPKLRPFYEQNPVYKSEAVELTILKDTLVRFRLLGQGSTAILAATLKVTEYPEVGFAENQAPPWWMKLESSSKAEHSEQAKLWENLSKHPFASRVPPSSVIGLTVHDPREALPVSRNKTAPNVNDICEAMGHLELTPQLSSSPLWNREVRDEVTFTKMPDCEMNKLRSQFLVPGTPLNLGNKGSRIPILLIQQPGDIETSEQNLVGVGWDIILPAGWAMAFWIPLVYRCARVGGYREHMSVARELRVPHFPDDYPDTSACQEEEKQQSQELVAKYFRYPPDKRPNFVKLGSKAPYSFPWQQLVSEWAARSAPLSDWSGTPPSSNGRFFVLRNQTLLSRLRKLCQTGSRKKFQRRENSESVPKFEEARWDNVLCPEHRFSLVPVRLRIAARGEVQQFSMVCEPSEEDLKALDKAPGYSGPCEPSRKDDLKDLRKETLENARKARKKKKSDASELETEVRAVLEQPNNSEENFDRLYVPSSDNIIDSCSRTIVGFAKSGNFSFSRGKTIGFAFLAFPALFKLLKDICENCMEPLLLVRSPHSYQYHYAYFEI